MTSILVLHGPNLNLLGEREPHIYGHDTLDDINGRLAAMCASNGHEFQTLQSNAEHELVDRLHAARNDGTDFILINPGAFTHTSVALLDAFLATGIPFIEVHLSNLHRREDFRQKSFLASAAVGTIVGLGAQGYELALQAAFKQLADKT
ncbi:MAG: type II 3-dehydroquinate dehydratase [Gammaproteobacteria bacterium]|nr:type II 3-dehydroquinate dehydratase [Gammaproteobacteria bacterium]